MKLFVLGFFEYCFLNALSMDALNMHIFLSFALIALTGLGTLFSSSSACAQTQTVKITTGEWEPFISEKYEHGGVILHIVKEAFSRKGLDVEFAFLPWGRAVAYVDNGSWDAMAVTGSRHSVKGVSYLHSDPVYVGRDVLFHRKPGSIQWETFQDLHGLTFGAALSYDYSDEYREALKNKLISRIVAPNASLLFPMLAANRFDVFIMDKRAGLYTYNTQYREKLGDAITYYDKAFSSLDYSVRFLDRGEISQQLLRTFNESLREMRDAGIIHLYYEKFEMGLYQTIKKP
jgi:polar amino acid transport system substrate-binding protein